MNNSHGFLYMTTEGERGRRGVQFPCLPLNFVLVEPLLFKTRASKNYAKFSLKVLKLPKQKEAFW